jgi:hypothetical protein
MKRMNVKEGEGKKAPKKKSEPSLITIPFPPLFLCFFFPDYLFTGRF